MIVFFNLVNELYRHSFLAGYSSDRNESQTELLLAEQELWRLRAAVAMAFIWRS